MAECILFPVRLALQSFLCLIAWLLLSPVAMAAPVIDAAPTVARHIMPCCQDGSACEMPGMQRDPLCPKCEPLVPLLVPAVVPDVAPPLFILPTERPLIVERLVVSRPTILVEQVDPPPNTLLALCTMLTC